MSAYSALILGTSGLVAYWRMDAPSGTSETDVTGNGHTGTYHGGVTLNQPSLLSNDTGDASVLLDGTTGYMSVPDAAALKPSSAVSVEMWLKPVTAAGFQYLIDNNGNSSGVTIQTDTTATHIYATVSTSVNIISGFAFNLADGNPHHLVLTYDGAHVTLFVDGSQITQVALTGAITWSSTGLTVGNEFSASQFTKGNVDEVAFYNVALTPTQVAAHYSAGTFSPAVMAWRPECPDILLDTTVEMVDSGFVPRAPQDSFDPTPN